MTTTTLTFTHDELVLLHRAIDQLQRQDVIASDGDDAVALDCLYYRIIEALPTPEPEVTYLVGEQFFTCPDCGKRTMPAKHGWEWCRKHGWFAVEDDETIDEDHKEA